jgi:UDP-N-acetylglucosamine 2-epimerase (non-hydrolysing)
VNEQPQLRTLTELESKVCVVLGTRPGIVMLSPVIRELIRRQAPYFVLHTDQHYSRNMDRQFFEDLGLPEPQHRLSGVAGQTLHGSQTAAMLSGCEQVFIAERPCLVLVGGDANTNLAAALAARKLHTQVGHVEAGERSMDWRMPEEHNRVVIDHISEYLFTTNEKASENLRREAVRGRIIETGNPIVDAIRENLDLAARRTAIAAELDLEPEHYVLMTVHREENVDSRAGLESILRGIELVTTTLPHRVLFVVHPRTQRRLREFGLEALAASIDGLRMVPAVGYLAFLSLLSRAALVLTDSGGVQQEACLLQVPCVTMRETTEWIETVAIGANMLVGTTPETILKGATEMLQAPRQWENPFGNGTAAVRIVDTVQEVLDPDQRDSGPTMEPAEVRA